VAVARDGVAPNLHIWRLSDGAPLRSMGQTPGAYALAYSPDGELLASAGFSPSDDGPAVAFHPGVVNLWNIESGTLARNIPANCGQAAYAVAFSHDGSLLATAGLGPVELWKTSDGTKVALIPNESSIYQVHFAPNDRQLVMVGDDGVATIWNIPSMTVATSLSIQVNRSINASSDVAFSPDGSLLAVQGVDGHLELRSALTGALARRTETQLQAVTSIVWLDQDRVITGEAYGRITLWVSRGGGPFYISRTWSIEGVSDMNLSPDRTKLVVVNGDITILTL